MEANKKNTASSIMEMLSKGNSNDEVSDNKSLQIIEQENQKQDEPVLLFNQRSEEDKKKDELERFRKGYQVGLAMQPEVSKQSEEFKPMSKH